MDETWKDVPGMEGLYLVSDYGRVKSLDRIIIDVHGHKRKIEGRILRQAKTKAGYLFVCLYKNNKRHQLRTNRLVALAFLENPLGFNQVGHDDDKKENNHASNLYWTNASENARHNGRHLSIGLKLSKPIVGNNGKDTVHFKSSIDAMQNGFNASAIRNCLSGRARTHCGYTWEHAC